MERIRGTGHRGARLVLWPALLLLFATPSGAEPETTPAVGLDRLLKIPPSLELQPSKRGHLTKTAWREKFDVARGDIEHAKRELLDAQVQLAETRGAGTAWKMGAPGLGAINQGSTSDMPLDPALSKKLDRIREDLERSERRLAEIDVEANLANVPEDWRGTPAPQSAAPGSQVRE